MTQRLRRGILLRRVERTLALLAAGCFLLFAATMALGRAGSSAEWLNAGVFSVVFLLAALQLTLRSQRRAGAGWGWIGLALAIFAAANLLYSAGDRLGVADPQAAGDVLWVLGFPPLVQGLHRLLRPFLHHGGALGLLDVTLVGLAGFALVATAVGDAMSRLGISSSSGLVGLNTLDLLGDAVLLAMVLGALYATGWRPPRWVWLLLLAVSTFTVSDAVYVVQVAAGTYREGGLLDLGWMAGAVLLGGAAVHAAGRPVVRRDNPRLQSALLAMVVPTTALLLPHPLYSPLSTYARVAAVLAALLASLRLYLALRLALTMAEQLRDLRVDGLTGLANLRALQALPPGTGRSAVFVAIDLDGLGEVNAQYGPEMGDTVLRVVADRLGEAIDGEDLLARIGGDEFGLLLRGQESTATAVRSAEELLEWLESELQVAGHRVRLSACAGVSPVGGVDVDITSLVAQAQHALHDAKRTGSGLVRSYAGVSGVRSQERLHLRAELRQALRFEPERFVPYFQPIVAAGEGGRILAAEALVRWRRDGRMVGPGEFLEELEPAGLQGVLTNHMFEASLRAVRDLGLDIAVTVNVPPALVDDTLPLLVHGVLAATGSEPRQLIVEITEDAIMRQPARAAEVLEQLRHAGVRVLLDDFGTGWSGLSALRDFAVDGIKLDASFVRTMTRGSTSAAIVESVVTLSERLGLLVIYEGIEDPAQLDARILQGGGFLQGFALAHPMPATDLLLWSRDRGITSPRGVEVPPTFG